MESKLTYGWGKLRVRPPPTSLMKMKMKMMERVSVVRWENAYVMRDTMYVHQMEVHRWNGESEQTQESEKRCHAIKINYK